MQHTDSIHAFKMADKIARQEGHREEYLNELLFCLMKTSQKLLLPQYSPLKIKIFYWFEIFFNHTFIQFLKRIAQRASRRRGDGAPGKFVTGDSALER